MNKENQMALKQAMDDLFQCLIEKEDEPKDQLAFLRENIRLFEVLAEICPDEFRPITEFFDYEEIEDNFGYHPDDPNDPNFVNLEDLIKPYEDHKRVSL